jgi:uncharacterized protein with HEPN domain
MNFDYTVLSNPELPLSFIEENINKFNKAEFNILSIFNKHISKEFREAYPLYPWSHYDHEVRLIELRSQFPIDYDSIKKENKKKIRDKFEKFEVITSKEDKHRHLKK